MPQDGTPELILHETRDRRRQQDHRLQRLLRLATTAPIIALSVGAVAVVVSEPLAAHAAVIVFAAAIGLSLLLVAIEAVASRWDVGPTIDRLLQMLMEAQPTLLQLQVSLINRLNRDYNSNEMTLTRIRWLLSLQALIVLAEAVILLLGFYELG